MGIHVNLWKPMAHFLALAVIFVVCKPAFALFHWHLLQHLFHWHFPWPRKKHQGMNRQDEKGWTARMSYQPRNCPSFFCVFSSPSGTRNRSEENQGRNQNENSKKVRVVSNLCLGCGFLFSWPTVQVPGIHIFTKPRTNIPLPPQRPASCTAACLFGVQYFNDAKKKMGMVYMNMCVCVFNKARKGWSTLGKAVFDRRKQWIWCL